MDAENLKDSPQQTHQEKREDARRSTPATPADVVIPSCECPPGCTGLPCCK